MDNFPKHRVCWRTGSSAGKFKWRKKPCYIHAQKSPTRHLHKQKKKTAASLHKMMSLYTYNTMMMIRSLFFFLHIHIISMQTSMKKKTEATYTSFVNKSICIFCTLYKFICINVSHPARSLSNTTAASTIHTRCTICYGFSTCLLCNSIYIHVIFPHIKSTHTHTHGEQSHFIDLIYNNSIDIRM